MKKTLSFLLAIAAATPIFAEETRELDAHEHGVGTLNIAFDKKTVAMEFHAPGADIVGFEYKATSDADRAAIDNAVALLAKPADLFVFPAAAECTVTKASAALEAEENHGDEDEDHAEHDEHAEHDDHAKHDEHAVDTGHTEFHAEYVLNCATPSAIDTITFAYFDIFENAREVEVQVVSASGAQAFEVKRDAPMLDMRSLF